MTPEEQKIIQERQRSRALIMARVLFALVVLFFGITIAKMS
jgi:preprotein translocase subunit SecG